MVKRSWQSIKWLRQRSVERNRKRDKGLLTILSSLKPSNTFRRIIFHQTHSCLNRYCNMLVCTLSPNLETKSPKVTLRLVLTQFYDQ